MTPPTTRPKIVAPVPRWQQIADYLREQILSGHYSPGQPLPSEQTLADEFALSRPTVRQGIAALVSEGLVTVRRPYGTVVRDPHARPGTLEHRALTYTPSAGYTEPDAPAWIDIDEPVFLRLDASLTQATLLDIDAGQPLATREVLQQADSGVRRTLRLYLPFSVAVDLHTPWTRDARLPAPTQLYTWLAQHGQHLRFSEYVRARMPVGDEAATLHMDTAVPLLVISRVTHTNRPLVLEEIRAPADQIEMSYPLPVVTRNPRPGRTTTSQRP